MNMQRAQQYYSSFSAKKSSLCILATLDVTKPIGRDEAVYLRTKLFS